MSGYKWAMDLNHRQLFWKLKKLSPLAIMCFLMNDEARKYYLPMLVRKDNVSDEAEKKVNIAVAVAFVKKEDDSTAVSYDIENNADKRNMYKAIC